MVWLCILEVIMKESASQKCFKANGGRRTVAYSRNSLMACFVGDTVLSSRTIDLSPNCNPSGGSQRTFFSLIPDDRSVVNDKTGEPQSPQLSCIGQVKHRHSKVAKSVQVITEDLGRVDINDGVIPHAMDVSKTDPLSSQKSESFKLHKGESFRLQKEESFRLQFEESFKLKNVESFKLRKEESFKVQKEESFKRQKEESFRIQQEVSSKLQKKLIPLHVQVDGVPHLDLACKTTFGDDLGYFDTSCVKNSTRSIRCEPVVEEEKLEDDEKVTSPSQKNSIPFLNHFLKQTLGASIVKGGFVCGWKSGEPSPPSLKSERAETESEHCELDPSRCASGESPSKTPSVRDTKPEGNTDWRSWNKETERKEKNDDRIKSATYNSITSSDIVVKCPPSAVILQPATEAVLWKRRCMPRPLSLEIPTERLAFELVDSRANRGI